ncbi:hypothetical protein [Mycobacterium cookii]|uniref:hypothetical protein n=1 Tax=Mycobacterium cookii TaxID=1775 RepID=UPI0013D1C6CF|nr:hypothetical protein [Mycobacterium cookii]MCV7331776.1 hypothetical protein [Mycobacterium cookii]
MLVICTRGDLRSFLTAAMSKADGRHGQHDQTSYHGGEGTQDQKGFPVRQDQGKRGQRPDSGEQRVNGHEASKTGPQRRNSLIDPVPISFSLAA